MGGLPHRRRHRCHRPLPTTALSYGKIVSRDWAIATAQAYNDWLHDTYVKRDSRFHGVGLIPMQEPAEAVKELRRCVEDLGFVGAMLPSFGLPDHLGSKLYWPSTRRLTASAAPLQSTAVRTAASGWTT